VGGWLAWWIASRIKVGLQLFVLMMLSAHRIARVHVRDALKTPFGVAAGKVGWRVQGFVVGWMVDIELLKGCKRGSRYHVLQHVAVGVWICVISFDVELRLIRCVINCT